MLGGCHEKNRDKHKNFKHFPKTWMALSKKENGARLKRHLQIWDKFSMNANMLS